MATESVRLTDQPHDITRLFMGTRVAIYNYATLQSGGWIDVDWFGIGE